MENEDPDLRTAADDADEQGANNTQIGGSRPHRRRWLFWLLILLLLLAALFGWLWWRDRDTKDTQNSNTSTSASSQTEDAEEATCDEDLTSYENAKLGFGFCYPTAWGTVTASDSRLAPSDTGSRWTISFDAKPAVNLGVASADWETTMGRDAVCSDPATPTLPPFEPFSTDWETFDEDGATTTASRGIEVVEGQYLIQEFATTTLAEVVCITGYTVLDGTPYGHTAASYSTTFNSDAPSPAAHMTSPNLLVSGAERNAFYAFVKSVHDL